MIRPDEVEYTDFWTPSKRYPFLIKNLSQIHHFLVKSGPSRFWHIFFHVCWRYYYEKHKVFQTFSLKNDSKNDKILRKRQGFSLFLKMRHFLKLKNINIMQEIHYFLEASVRAGPPTYSYYAGNTSFFVEARWQTWQNIQKTNRIFIVFEN